MKTFAPDRILHILRDTLRIDQTLTGDAYLRALVCRMAATFDAMYVQVAHPSATDPGRIETRAVCKDGAIQENFSYELDKTPCQKVLSGRRVCVFPVDVAKAFPEDFLLGDWGAASYVGAPVLRDDGTLEALLVMLGRTPIESPSFFEAIGEFFAERVAVVLRRSAFESELRMRVAERTEALEAANRKLRAALREVKTLRGIIPICMECGQVRNEEGYWQRVDAYVSENSSARFSHGYCELCCAKVEERLFGTPE